MKYYLTPLLSWFLICGQLNAQAFRNLNFEHRSDQRPVPQMWYLQDPGKYDIYLDSIVKYEGKYSLKMEVPTQYADGYAYASLSLPLDWLKGKTVVLKGMIRTRGITKGYAGLWIRADGKDAMAELGYEDMEDRGIKGTTDWQKVSVSLAEVDTSAVKVVIGVNIEGPGIAWFDNLEVWIDGRKFEDGLIDINKVTKWISKKTAPLKTVQAEQGMEDLQFLKPILDGVRLVGLGEATHGTREFFQMKHRLLEFLVKEMGFTVFALEASYPACQNINDYILHGKGTKEEALASQGFWTWDTEEVLQMIEWMREYNKTVPKDKKVKFVGFDIQVLRESEQIVHDFLAKEDTLRQQAFDTTMRVYNKLRRRTQPEDTSGFQLIQRDMNALLAFLVLNEGSLSQKYSSVRFRQTLEHLRVLMQAIDAKFTQVKGLNRRQNARDYYMAENVQYLINQEPPDTKFVIWAHNTHVSGSSDDFVNRGLKPLGSYLRNTYGKAYYAVSFAFNQGGFQAMVRDSAGMALSPVVLPPAESPTFEYLLTKSGQELCFLDLRSLAGEKEVVNYLKHNLILFSVGTQYDIYWEMARSKMLIPNFQESFDGLIFIKTTTRAIPSQKIRERMRVK